MTTSARVTLTAMGAALGGFLFGFDTSTMNAAIPGIRSTLGLGTGTVGFVAAIALLGCAVGAWFAGPVAARHGRTRVMFIAGMLIAIGSAGVAIIHHVAVIGLFRFVVGLGIGGASAVVPAYIVEISPTEIRGRLGSLWQFGIVVGQLGGLLGGYGLTTWAGSEAAAMPWGGAAWRWMFAVVAALAAAYTVITRRLPPSPNDAHRSSAGDSNVRRLSDLRGPRLGLQGIVWTGIVLATFQQLVGISVVKTYSNTLWQVLGFSTASAFGISIVTVLMSIASTIVAIAIIDRVGRRTLLVWGAVVMTVALGAMALSFATSAGDGETLGRPAAVAALIAMNMYAIGFGVTWGPVMWVMLGELFDSRIRTIAVAVSTAVNWLANWMVTRTFPLLAGGLGLGVAYGLYAAFAALAVIFVLKTLPETRGRRLA